MNDMQEIFTKIYKEKRWPSKNDESVSGSGSTIDATENVRSALPYIFSRYKIKSILDLPCGDFNWFKHIDLKGIKYIGGDIVPELIAKNKKYETENISFQVLDIASSELPKADLLMCRDLFVHMSFEDIKKSLENIRGKYRYILATSFDTVNKNRDIVTGQWRVVNMELEPFFFKNDHEMIDEGKVGREKEGGVPHKKYLILYENPF